MSLRDGDIFTCYPSSFFPLGRHPGDLKKGCLFLRWWGDSSGHCTSMGDWLGSWIFSLPLAAQSLAGHVGRWSLSPETLSLSGSKEEVRLFTPDALCWSRQPESCALGCGPRGSSAGVLRGSGPSRNRCGPASCTGLLVSVLFPSLDRFASFNLLKNPNLQVIVSTSGDQRWERMFGGKFPKETFDVGLEGRGEIDR